MPLSSADAPKTLPPAGKRLWAAAFNNAYESCKEDDVCAGKVAWTVVKKKFMQKSGGLWCARSTLQTPGGMYITKVSRDQGTGERRWSSTASDSGWDWYNQRMTPTLFDNFIRRAESGEVPPAFTSDAWSGGMPYLGVAHYLDLDGLGIAGPTRSLYRDGEAFKAKGIFENTAYPEIADAAFNNALADVKLPTDQRARISIAFLDMVHRHTSNNTVFERRSLSDVCLHCEEDPELVEYLDGFLIHLALTRIPANWRVDFNPELETRSMDEEEEEVSAQLADAASIIGKDLASRLETKAKNTVVKSTAGSVVIKSEDVPSEQPQVPASLTPDATLATRMQTLEDMIAKLLSKQGVNMPEPTTALQAVTPASAHPLDETLATLRSTYDRIVSDPSMDRTAKMAALNGPVNELSSTILRGVAASTPVSTSDLEQTIRKVVNELLTPVLAGLTAQQAPAVTAPVVPPVTLSTAPIVRSAQMPPQAPGMQAQPMGQVLSIRDIARLTSGLPIEQKGA